MAKDIYGILRRKFPEKEYALMQEVSDAAGFNRSNSADFIIVNLWPSRGLAISGIELKSFRSDWLSELKKPDKAENIFKYCDHFWLLTTDDTIAKIDEIPINWGWMCIKGERIFIKKEAPTLKPLPISRNFMAAMLKRAQDKKDFIHKTSIKEEIFQATNKAQESNQKKIDTLTGTLTDLQKSVADFQTASGIDLARFTKWSNVSAKEVGAAVKLISNGGIEDLKKDLARLEERAKEICNNISHHIQTLTDVNATT